MYIIIMDRGVIPGGGGGEGELFEGVEGEGER